MFKVVHDNEELVNHTGVKLICDIGLVPQYPSKTLYNKSWKLMTLSEVDRVCSNKYAITRLIQKYRKEVQHIGITL